MKIIHKSQTKTFKNSENCVATEYPLGEKDINGALVELTGRYPSAGRVMNLKCKELVYVVRGFGTVILEGEKIKLVEGDMVLIEPGEKYFWNGTLTLFISSAPAWYPEQHKGI